MKRKITKDSLSDQAYEIIKDSILNFKRKPGDKLIIDEICRDLELSNTPIREAIRRLQQEGLIEQKVNSGFFVKKITYKESIEYSELIKIILLGSIQELIIRGIIKNVIEDLEKHLTLQKEYFEKGDSVNFLIESIAFDEVFIKHLNNKIIIERVKKCNEMFSFSVFIFHKNNKNKEKSIKDHTNIITSIKNEQYNNLIELIRNHYKFGTSEELY